MRVHVAFAGPQGQSLVTIDVPEGATVQDAIEASGLGLASEVGAGVLECAIYGRRVDVAARLVAGDRVEMTRALVCDPKVARRRRAVQRPARKESA
jgi:putative ubiquitin-RnfH superfamily antitoxin RatB of RatAB toxin-antitoxin module